MNARRPWYHKLLVGNLFSPCSKLKKYEAHASQISLPESTIEDDLDSNKFLEHSTPKTRKFSSISFGYTSIIDALKRNSSVSESFKKEVVQDIEEIEKHNSKESVDRKKSGSSCGDSAVSSMSEGNSELSEKKKIEL